MVKINIVNNSSNPLPAYKTSASAGMDLHAMLSENITLEPMARALIPTGIFIELPIGLEAQVRPRSGLALKNGVSVLNAPGTIDADYRGEIGVVLINLSQEPFVIKHGERVAQLVVAAYESVSWQPVTMLDGTARGTSGFSSTGK